MTLTGPLLPPFGAAPTNWMLSPGTGAWTPPSDLTAIAAKLATATPSGAPGGVVTPGVLGETAYGLNLPPLLQGTAGPTRPGGFTAPNTSTPAYGYGLAFGRSVWLGLQGPGMSPLLTANLGQHPWNWLNQLQQPLWGTVNQAFTDALTRAKTQRDPFQLYATQVFQSAVGRVGATVSGDWGAVLGAVVDFLAGFLNGLTGGLLGHVIGLGEWLTGINLNGFVDPSSSAYAAGGQTAGVALLVLMVAAPEAMPALLAMQALGQGWSAAAAFQRGDYATGFLDLGNGILAGVGAGEAAEAGEAGSLAAAEAEAPAAAETAAEALPAGAAEAPAAGLGAAEGEAGAGPEPGRGGHAGDGQAADGGGRPVSHGGGVPHAGPEGNWQCFPPGTLAGASDGPRRVEAVRNGDRLWACNLASGEWRLCRVIQTLTREYNDRSVRVTAAGETVESTRSHAWWVVRRRGVGRAASSSRPAGRAAAGGGSGPLGGGAGPASRRPVAAARRGDGLGGGGGGWPVPRGGVQLPRGRAGVLLRRRGRLPRPQRVSGRKEQHRAADSTAEGDGGTAS